MYIEQWWRAFCPHCDRVNWVCNGDLRDVYQADAEGFSCWKCQSQVPLTDRYLYEDEDDLQEYEAGLRYPPKE